MNNIKLNESEKKLLINTIDTELIRFNRLKRNSKDIKEFEEIYGEHIKELDALKQKLSSLKVKEEKVFKLKYVCARCNSELYLIGSDYEDEYGSEMKELFKCSNKSCSAIHERFMHCDPNSDEQDIPTLKI